MRSIRLSLVLYFLLLEAAVLGAAAWLIYHTAGDSLRTVRESKRLELVAQFEERRQRELKRLDDRLLDQARAIADLTRTQVQWKKLEVTPFLTLGILSTSLAPQGHVLAPLWDATQRNNAFQLEILRRVANEITVSEETLASNPDPTTEEYFQINSEWGSSWRSTNLGANELPFDPEQFANAQAIDWSFDDVTAPSGFPGRSVQFKSPITRFRVERAPSNTNLPLETIASTDRNAQQPNESVYPWMVVQFVSETRNRDAAIAKHNADLSRRLNAMLAHSAETEKDLWARLAGIGILTFAGTVFGGSVLVGLGLSPLRRLTEAVSRVSSHDFRLPLDDKKLPRELDPIAVRLRATLEELRRAFDREKQAAADISHELRTPVAALLATLDVSLRKPRTADEYRQTLTEARSIGAQMRQLVERLLALARLDAGVAKVRTGTVDVGDLVEQCLSLVRPLAAAREIKLSGQCPPHLPWYTDGDKLREVLINLLHNAIQYNRDGGTVTVTASRNSDALEITVADTGIGIAEEAIPHLFERFYRADPSRQASELNAGLGLSIVRGYIDLLGGEVTVSSTPGHGTTFRVTLSESPADRSREAA